MEDDTQLKIRLKTVDGMTGYRIKKFELINKDPGVTAVEGICKIYKVKQTAIDGEVDFDDSLMILAGYYAENGGVTDPVSTTVIMEEEIFNQDIFVTYHENIGSQAMNFYLELEQVKLNQNSQTVVTLKDIRANIN